MIVKPIQNNVSSEMAKNTIKPDVVDISREMRVAQKSSPSKIASSPTVSPLSSRYTYALGEDGRRYVLQLRITLPGGGFNALA